MLVKKARFAEMCGKSRAYISRYVTINKIVTNEQGLIDTDHPANAAFLKKGVVEKVEKEAKAELGIIEEPVKKTPPKEPVKQKQKFKSEKIVTPPETGTKSNSEGWELGLKKLQADVDKKLIDIEKTTLEVMKLKGKLIPTDLVSSLISQLSHSFIVSYKEAASQLMIEFSHRKKLSAKDEAEMKGELVKAINKCHDRAINEAKVSLKTLVSLVKPVKQSVIDDEDE